MIFVVRPPESVDVREALCKPLPAPGSSEKKTELEQAREYYSQNPTPKKAYEFRRYKEWAVCRALDDLFHQKCAYCESSYRAVDARDVEHYRPKGGVTEARGGHPGYWWLAAAWRNLLPSCPGCNQRRRQTVFDPGMSIEEFEQACRQKPHELTGKANSFPVQGDNWVATEAEWLANEQQNIAVEDPLLINPCERDPANHLEFFFEWDRKTYIWEADPIYALVRPKSSAGVDDPYAKASIAIYGLNRAGLVRERAARVKDLEKLCLPVVDLAREMEELPSPAELARILARLKQYRANLIALTQPDQTYAGMARAFLAEFERELTRLANDAG
jgi:hypothetical protein